MELRAHARTDIDAEQEERLTQRELSTLAPHSQRLQEVYEFLARWAEEGDFAQWSCFLQTQLMSPESSLHGVPHMSELLSRQEMWPTIESKIEQVPWHVSCHVMRVRNSQVEKSLVLLVKVRASGETGVLNPAPVP